MKKAGFWTTDSFLGLAVAIVFFFLAGTPFVQSVERALNTDGKLAERYRTAGTALAPMPCKLGDTRGKPGEPLAP